jgi:phosphoglycerol transferase MdoB-like AlkP superfamily enzyme
MPGKNLDLLQEILVAPKPNRVLDGLIPPKPSRLQENKQPFFFKYGLLIFFVITICYFELIYRLWIFNNLSADYIFPILYALPSATMAFLVSKLFSQKINKAVAFFIILFFIFVYSFHLIYYYIFGTPFSLYSGFRAGYAFQFWNFVLEIIFKNCVPLVFIIAPFVLLVLLREKISFSRIQPVPVGFSLVLAVAGYAFFVLGIDFTRTENLSQYALYYQINSPELSVQKLGVLPTQSIDLKRYCFGFKEEDSYLATANAVAFNTSTPPEDTSNNRKDEPAPPKTYNVMDIDFQNLIASEKDPNILPMHEYFSSLSPTNKNDYTGVFKGNNLIFIVAESFSPYAISADLTPTLYKMSHEGFVFNDFYNSAWGVGTSDGEYVSDVGLIPKSGIWSMLASSQNYLPLVLGNQFKKNGYVTKAYHDNTYTYYKRNISIPNLGYDYKGLGSGVNVTPTWPESDLEMVENTTDEYLNQNQPFHVYYITVSGHLEYNFSGNYISKKNKEYVDNLPYSDEIKAYLAANLELEFAMQRLIQKLDTAGVLKNTAIAIVNDHYPYGLTKASMDELAGHQIESNFEKYKGVFILWKQGLAPIEINKPVCNFDILPTLSNLFGLNYDSRLLVGTDVFSDTPPLAIFHNRSWITSEEKYNSTVKHKDSDYEKMINKTVSDKFKYSAKILDTDYYRKIF